jgi:pyruvate, water dikinase
MRTMLGKLDAGRVSLSEAGRAIRQAIFDGDWPEETRDAILAAYRQLGERVGLEAPSVAVRSSATAEDLPDASFAGQQETYLNVRGEAALLEACRRCYASLFTDRAISYRKAKGFEHEKVALSVGVQQMVRSDIGGAGVMFSIDTETGLRQGGADQRRLGPRRERRAGGGDARRVPGVQALPRPDPELTPILEKKLRLQGASKMVYAGDGGTTKNVPTSKAERARFVLDDGEILELARAGR